MNYDPSVFEKKAIGMNIGAVCMIIFFFILFGLVLLSFESGGIRRLLKKSLDMDNKYASLLAEYPEFNEKPVSNL